MEGRLLEPVWTLDKKQINISNKSINISCLLLSKTTLKILSLRRTTLARFPLP